MTQDCKGVVVEALPYDIVTARVMHCQQTIGPGEDEGRKSVGRIQIFVVGNVTLLVQVSFGNQFWLKYYYWFPENRRWEEFFIAIRSGQRTENCQDRNEEITAIV